MEQLHQVFISFLKSNESILINYISKDERDMIDNY